MKDLVRKWTVALRRRRMRRQRRAQGDYRVVEQSIRDGGHRCSNCNVQLHGHFCHICGQKDDDLRRPIWTFFQELLDNLLQADSKMLRSLITLLLVPGGLTRAYMNGQRARYSPPLRFYLIASLGFFLILSVADVLILDINLTPRSDAPSVPAAAALPADAKAADNKETDTQAKPSAQPAETGAGSGEAGKPADAEKAAPAVPQAPAVTSDDPADIAARREEAKAQLRKLLGEKGLALPEDTRKMLEAEVNKQIDAADGSKGVPKGVTADQAKEGDNRGMFIGNRGNGFEMDIPGLPYKATVSMFVHDSGKEHIGLTQAEIDKMLTNSDMDATGNAVLRGLARVLKNPTAFNDLLNKWLPRTLFVLIPLFALILRVFHWGKQRYYMNQLVFALHFHTFLFLLLTALIVIIPQFGGLIGMQVFWGVSSLYLIIALKIGEDQGWIRAFLKAGFIWVSYTMFMVTGLGFAVVKGLSEL